MIRTVLFDLDDTLYPEGEYYRSGFAVVAACLEERGVGPAEANRALFEQLHFGEGRERVFDKAAARLEFPAAWIPELVRAFHDHRPRLQLPQESAEVLAQLRGRYRLGIVTDGHAAVQRRKLEALELADRVDAIVITDDLGREYWKPHPLPFWNCCQRLESPPDEAVFVGDHPERDIQGARRAGLRAIRLRRPDSYFASLATSEAYPADREIRQLAELPGLLEHLPCLEASRR